MRTPERRIAIIGALLGAFASAYLLVDYVFGSGICLTGSGCDVVRSSAFAYPLGIPMPLLGLGFYLAAVVLLLRPSPRIAGMSAGLVAAGWAVIGLGVMAILTLIELFVIGALCSWCLLSTVASVLLAAGAIAAWRRGNVRPFVGESRSSRTRRRMTTEVERSRHDLRRFAATTGAVLGVALVALLALPAMTGGTLADRASVGSADRPRLGDGPVEVVVYSDFQCPACAVAAPILSGLSDDGSISLVYRYFPLVSIHLNAVAAAEAAQAAALQGAFWEFHDVLFAGQSTWAELAAPDARTAFEAIAVEVSLDIARWRADAASSTVAEVVASDRRSAEELRLSGTPTIFVDGVRYGGPLNRDALLRAVESASTDLGSRSGTTLRAWIRSGLCAAAERGCGLRNLSRDQPAHDKDRGPRVEQDVVCDASGHQPPQRSDAARSGHDEVGAPVEAGRHDLAAGIADARHRGGMPPELHHLVRDLLGDALVQGNLRGFGHRFVVAGAAPGRDEAVARRHAEHLDWESPERVAPRGEHARDAERARCAIGGQ